MTSYEESKRRAVGVLLGGAVVAVVAHRKIPLLCRPRPARKEMSAATDAAVQPDAQRKARA
jgi:hypothetical protein